MDNKNKRIELAKFLWGLGVPMVASALITTLESDWQFWVVLSLGFALMIASAFIYAHKVSDNI